MNIIKRNIPNAITCLNVLSGTFSILAALHASQVWLGLSGLQWAWVLIGVAAVADFCDGLAARALKAYSSLGKELDSLCDLVSFGVAPAIIANRSIILTGGPEALAWCTPLIVVGGALRLARFNVSPENNALFTGLPIPANAIFWIGYSAWLLDLEVVPWPLTAIAIALSAWLMVSPLRLYTLKFKTWTLRGNLQRWSIVLAAVVCCLCMGVPGLMWTIIYYIGLSLAFQSKLR